VNGGDGSKTHVEELGRDIRIIEERYQEKRKTLRKPVFQVDETQHMIGRRSKAITKKKQRGRTRWKGGANGQKIQ